MRMIDLANILNNAQSVFHVVHFNARSGEGGSFDDVHNIIGEYYETMLDDYDTAVELAHQCGEDIEYAPLEAFNSDRLPYLSAFEIVQQIIESCLDAARLVHESYSGNDINSIAVCNFIEDFIMRWSKESRYKVAARLGEIMDQEEQIRLGKAIIKSITDADPLGKVRKSGGASYRKTAEGWIKLPSKRNSQQYSGTAEEIISGLSNTEVKKALESVKFLIRKARRGFDDGHISHRADGDYKKTGGTWVKVPTNERQGQSPDVKQPQSGGATQQGANPNALAPEPPNPVEDRLNNRSLGSMASHTNEGFVQSNMDGIQNMVNRLGVDGTIKRIKAAFEAKQMGDLFDMNMPINQLAEISAKAGVDLSYDEGNALSEGFARFNDGPPEGDYPEATAEVVEGVLDPADGLGDYEGDGQDYGEDEGEHVEDENPYARFMTNSFDAGTGVNRDENGALINNPFDPDAGRDDGRYDDDHFLKLVEEEGEEQANLMWDAMEADYESEFGNRSRRSRSMPQAMPEQEYEVSVDHSVNPTIENQRTTFDSEEEADAFMDKNDSNMPYMRKTRKSFNPMTGRVEKTGVQPAVPIPHGHVGKDHATGFASGDGQESHGRVNRNFDDSFGIQNEDGLGGTKSGGRSF